MEEKMKHFIKDACLLLLLMITGCIWLPRTTKADDLGNFPGDPRTSIPRMRMKRLNIKLEPVLKTQDGSNVQILLTVKSDTPLNEIKVYIGPGKDIILNSPSEWTDSLNGEKEKSYVISVTVPKNVKSAISPYICSQVPFISGQNRIFFDNTGDTLMVYDIFSAPKPKPKPSPNADPIRDTLTEEQLQTEYEVILVLRNSNEKKTAEHILGMKLDSYLINKNKGYYKLRISLANLIKLAEQPIGFEYTTPPPWDKRHHLQKVRPRKKQRSIDSVIQ